MLNRILIVDDNEVNRGILSKMLIDDYDVTEVACGKEALEILRCSYGGISAVLLDVVMPEMDGYEVLRTMRSTPALAPIPVMICTGCPDNDAEVKALSYGANDFITKPYNAEVLRHRLKNIIDLCEKASAVNFATIDELTGLYNRKAFFVKATELIVTHPPGYYIMSCFDVDNFKVINDQYGSAKGDDVLKHIASVFEEGFSPVGGICCRVMADNFAVLYPRSFADSDAISEIRKRAAMHDDGLLSITFSIGRYLVTDPRVPVISMYDRAVLAETSIKGRYDSKIAYYNQSMREHLLNEQQIVVEMHNALKNGEFEVWLQPQYNHSTGALIGSEALVRWRRVRKGMLVFPTEFVPVFERNGFIYELDKYVWEQVCVLLRGWLDAGRSPLPISVNVSRKDVFHAGFYDVITGLVRKYNIPIDMLRLEITESAFAKSTTQIIAVVKRLVEFGFTIEIDDFGSGYSSLNTLKDVPAKVLKLDMRFLEKNENSARGGNILESIVRMAKWLDMSVIAEGVETREQADYLKTIGCNYVQGYLYDKPMQVHEFEDLESNIVKESRLQSFESVVALDNDAFWNPESMETLIFNSYVGGACIFEYSVGKVEMLRANDKYAKVLAGDNKRFTLDAALKISWRDHLDEKNRQIIRIAIEEAIRSRDEVTCEAVFSKMPWSEKDIYLRLTLRILATAGSHYLVYCSNENMTAQREAEQKEHAAAEHMRIIMDNVNGGVSAVTLDDQGAFRLVFANETFFSMFGYTSELFDSEVSSVFDVVHPDDRDRIKERVANVLRDRLATTYEYRCYKRTGELVYARCHASVTKMPGVNNTVLLAVITDITEIVQAQKMARQTAERLEAVVNNIDGGVSAVTMSNGRFEYLFVNDRYYSMLGYTKERFDKELPNKIIDLMHPDDIPEVFAFTEQLEQTGVPRLIEFRARKCDGSWMWVRRRSSVFHFEGIDVPVQLSVSIDITKEKEATQKIIETGNQLKFLNDAAHGLFTEIDPETGLNGILKKVMEYLCGERAFIFEFIHDKGLLNNTYEVCAPGVVSGKTNYQNVPKSACSFLLETINHNDFINIEDVDALDDSHKNEREILQGNGIKSLLVVPLMSHGNPIGFFGVDNPTVQLSQIDIMKTIGDYISSILIRRDLRNRIENNSLIMSSLMNDTPGGFVRMRVMQDESFCIDYVNQGFCRMIGFTADQIFDRFSRDVYSRVHPEDSQIVATAVSEMLKTGKPMVAKYRLLNSNNQYVPVMAFGRLIVDTSGERLLNMYYTDLTEQEKREVTLREMLPVALSAMMKTSTDLIFVKDVNLKYLFCSRAFANLCGAKSEKEIVGKTDFDLFEKNLAEQYRNDDRKLIDDGESLIDYIESIPSEDGVLHYSCTSKYLLHDELGNIIGLYGLGRDVTEYRDAYQQLKLLTDSVPGGLATFSCTENTIRMLYFTKGYHELTGYSYEEYKTLATNNPTSLVYKEDFPAFWAKINAMLRGETSEINSTHRVYPKGGGCIWVNVRGTVIERTADTVFINCVMFDVTATKKNEEKLRMSEEQYRLAMSHSGTIIARYDVEDKSVNLSEEVAALFGTPTKVFDVPYSPVQKGGVHPESVDDYINFYERILHGEKSGSASFRCKTTQGWTWLSSFFTTIYTDLGAPAYAIISFYDISEQVRNDEENRGIRANEELLRLAIEQSTRLVYRYDIATKEARSVDAKVSTIMGLPEYIREVPESLIQDGVIVPEDADYVRELFTKTRDKEGDNTMRFRVRNNRGDVRWLDAKYTLVMKDSIPSTAVISCVDITDQHEREIAYVRYRQVMSTSHGRDLVFLETDLTADVIEKRGGDMLPDKLMRGHNTYTQTIQYFLDHWFIDENREKAAGYFRREQLLGLFEKGVSELADDWANVGEDAKSRWVRVSLQMITDPYTQHVRVLFMCKDISEEKQRNLDNQKRANLDGMTELLNRVTTERSIKQVLQDESNKRNCVLLIIDLDNLKDINDNLGHAQGDNAIKSVANTIKNHFRKTDIVGRVGGDEYLVFIDNVTTEAQLHNNVSALLKEISSHVMENGKKHHLHCSIGCAMGIIGRDTFEQLYNHADTALYHVKRNGKNDYAFYTEDMLLADYQYGGHGKELSLQNDEMFGKKELQHLLSTISSFFPLVISVNLTRNEFYMMEHERFLNKALPEFGTVDSLIESASALVHVDDRKEFVHRMSRESLLKTCNGKCNSIHDVCRLLGDDGDYHWIEMIVMFYREDNGDVCEFSLVRNFSDEKSKELELLSLHKIMDLAVASSFEYICLVHTEDGSYDMYGNDGHNTHTICKHADFVETTIAIRDSHVPEAERKIYYKNALLSNVIKAMKKNNGHYKYRYTLLDGEREAEFYYCEPTHKELLMTVRRVH